MISGLLEAGRVLQEAPQHAVVCGGDGAADRERHCAGHGQLGRHPGPAPRQLPSLAQQRGPEGQVAQSCEGQYLRRPSS